MKQLLQAANIKLFNPLIHKAHNSDCQNLQFPLKIKPGQKSVKSSLRIYILCPLVTNGLK